VYGDERVHRETARNSFDLRDIPPGFVMGNLAKVST
jgi:hypothetical protein